MSYVGNGYFGKMCKFQTIILFMLFACFLLSSTYLYGKEEKNEKSIHSISKVDISSPKKQSLEEAKTRYLKWKANREKYLNHNKNLKHARVRYQAYKSAKQKNLLKKSKEHFSQLKKRKDLINGKDKEKYVIKKFTVKTTKDGKIETVGER